VTRSRFVPFVSIVTIAGACSDRSAPVAPVIPVPVLEVARERLLPLEDRDHRPLFGPDGAVTVGSSRFAPDGRRGSRSHWSQNGQIHPVGVIGTAARPQVLSLAWSAYPHPSGGEVADHGAWLIAGDPDGHEPTSFAPTGIEFANESDYEDGPTIELSPDRSAIVAIEHASVDEILLEGAEAHPDVLDALVVRTVPAGKQLARVKLPAGAAPRACWIDTHRLAWRESPKAFSQLDLTTQAITHTHAPAGELVACAAGGGSAVLATPTALAIVDLTTGHTRATIAVAPIDAPRGTSNDDANPDDEANERAPRDHFALGAGGCDVAMIRGRTLTVLRCEALRGVTWYRTTLVRTLGADVRPPSRLSFSPDARRLALVGDTLVLLETSVPHHAPPALPTMTELPAGFAAVTKRSGMYDAWGYAQLGTPTRLAPLPAQLVHARRIDDDPADVVTVAMELDAVSAAPPAPDASDAAIKAYALAIMPELFDQWGNAEVGSDRDAEFTLKVGHRDGKPFFETREAWRDGCEPYDGYTQVVIDRDLLFVTRALVVPAASTNPWLQLFFDVPFQRRTQLARRRGPETGPC